MQGVRASRYNIQSDRHYDGIILLFHVENIKNVCSKMLNTSREIARGTPISVISIDH